jgi:hypothetical protein
MSNRDDVILAGDVKRLDAIKEAAFRRGAEAMREAAAKWHDRKANSFDGMSLIQIETHKRSAEALRALPLPGAP